MNPNFSNSAAYFGIAALKAIPDGERPTNMRKKYFDWEYVFAFIWKDADRDGVWDGHDATVAGEFGVTEDAAHEVLGELCDRGLIERLYPGKCAVVEWRERDEPADDLPT